ncbi:MAG: TetR family transcriptional regulator [Actinophytocola sp.]|uniref:TetR/AcrR family transcriptional regulator n=1 Tax=Actinophytocola sp. TaxID=1872138 RepID=UPI001329FD28|nr:TetR/AcrR family transcriptional regulator [Actinophytocola sp.]MPZ86451.1 TetR family transcriptional regulator [Actinophytocola sp.]
MSSSTRRPSPTPTERGRRARDAIIDAACALVYDNGIAATSVDNVLAASSTGKSQFYHYFSGKQELLTAVIGRQLDRVLASQPRLEGLSTWREFDEWAADIIAHHSTPAGPMACPLGCLVGELDSEPLLARALDAAYRQWEAPLAHGLRTLRDRGELRTAADPDRLAATTMAALQGGLMLAHLRHDVTVLTDTLTMALDHLKSHRARRSR